jgi:16S rRNA (cytosine1402-N4)-methyltransferase
MTSSLFAQEHPLAMRRCDGDAKRCLVKRWTRKDRARLRQWRDMRARRMSMTTGCGAPIDKAPNARARHISVLIDEAMTALDYKRGGRYIDATFGAGGYTQRLLSVPNVHVLALDRDPSAIRAGADVAMSGQGRARLVEARFSQLEEQARAQDFMPVDGVVFDIGVSSMQFDEAARGFSFRGDGPLDMRMEARGQSAGDIVNTADEDALADIFYYYGEERASRRIARAIVHDRATAPFLTTKSLAELIERVARNRAIDIHPATKSVQALRIAVNNELGELLEGLAAAERVLTPGGRLAVVSFHSLEDRIVKLFLSERSGRGETGSRRLPGETAAHAPSLLCEGRQPVAPTLEERNANPRARSAKLRFAIRTAAPAHPLSDRLRRLVRLPAREKGKA